MKIERSSWLLAFTLFPALISSQTAPTASSMRDGGMPERAVRYVGGRSMHEGADIGSEINSAYDSLPPGGGTIVVIANPSGACYDFTTPIIAARPGKYVLVEGAVLPSDFFQPTSTPCLNYEPTTASNAITLDYVPPDGTDSLLTYGIRNLMVINNNCRNIGGCGSDATGITLGGPNGGARGATFEGVRVAGFGTGINVVSANSGDLSFRRCELSYNATGVADTHGETRHISFDDCRFQANRTGVSSRASVTVSNSSLSSNVAVGITCLSPAVCDLTNDHFDNRNVDTTHFLSGNGVFSVLGGDMQDDCRVGTSDWWMNFAGKSFVIIGTLLSSNGRTTSNVILNKSTGIAVINVSGLHVTDSLYLNPQLIGPVAQNLGGSPNRATQPAVTLPSTSNTVSNLTVTGNLTVGGMLAGNVAVKFRSDDSVRYVSAMGNDLHDGLSPGTAMATVNHADSSIGNGTNNNGAIILTGQVTSTSQIRLGARHALLVYGLLQISQPILMGDGATLDCVIPRGSPGDFVNEGGIVAMSNMAQMIRGVTQDGTTEMFTIRNCGLDGGYNTFTAPGLIDTTGMNDRTTVENNEIIHFSGSACIGASNARTNSTSFQFWLNNWCNATGKNASCAQLLATGENGGSINNIDIENLECGNWSTKYGFLIQNSGTGPSNTINNVTLRGLKGLGGQGSALLRIDNAWQVVVDNPHLFDGSQSVVDVSSNLGNVGIVLTNVENNARTGCYVYDHLNNNCVTNTRGGHVVLPFYPVWNNRSPNAIVGCASIVCGSYTGPAPTILPANGFNTGSLGNGNGSQTFTLAIGWGPANSTGTISLPSAARGWLCSASNLTHPGTNLPRQSGGSTTAAVLTNYDAAGAVTDWTSGDVLQFHCEPY